MWQEGEGAGRLNKLAGGAAEENQADCPELERRGDAFRAKTTIHRGYDGKPRQVCLWHEQYLLSVGNVLDVLRFS